MYIFHSRITLYFSWLTQCCRRTNKCHGDAEGHVTPNQVRVDVAGSTTWGTTRREETDCSAAGEFQQDCHCKRHLE